MNRDNLKAALSQKHLELQTAYMAAENQEYAVISIIEYLGEYVKNNILPDTRDFQVVVTDDLDKDTRGQCYYDYDLVAINAWYFRKALAGERYQAFLRCFDTVIHELRHVWQYMELWDFSDYVNPEVDMDGYYNHPTEVDARDFAKASIHNLWSALLDIYTACIDIIKAL